MNKNDFRGFFLHFDKCSWQVIEMTVFEFDEFVDLSRIAVLVSFSLLFRQNTERGLNGISGVGHSKA